MLATVSSVLATVSSVLATVSSVFATVSSVLATVSSPFTPSSFLILYFKYPESRDKFNAINNQALITVNKINGKNTIIHDNTVNPDLHKRFNIIVNMNINMNFNSAVLYILLNKSITICVNVKPIYNNAGVHNLSVIIYYLLI